MPRIAPPPLGKEIEGAEKLDCSDGLLFSCFACGVELSQHLISLLQPCAGSMEPKDGVEFENSFRYQFGAAVSYYKTLPQKVNIVIFLAKIGGNKC
jgi:hypothetical protein